VSFNKGFEKQAFVAPVTKAITAPLRAAYKVGKWGVQKVMGKGLGGLANMALTGLDAASSGSDYYKKMTTAR
jgi:hypothetical protein